MSKRGFTLLELITVIAILASVAAFAVPAIHSLRDQSGLITMERELVSTLRIARSAAITSNALRRVVITPPRQLEITDANGVKLYSRSLDFYGNSVRIDGAGPITLTYDGRGLLSPPNAVSLVLRNGDGEQKTITVFVTGKSQVG